MFYYNENILYATYIEQISYDRILKLYENSQNYRWITIIITPLIVLLRICYTTFALSIGDFFADFKIGIRQCFNISLKAELVFVGMSLVKLVFIEFVWKIKTLNDLSSMPFSLQDYFKELKLPLWSTAVLSYINVWEILYVFLLAGLLSSVNNKKFKSNIVFVVSTYGIALLFWIVILTYIAITLA